MFCCESSIFYTVDLINMKLCDCKKWGNSVSSTESIWKSMGLWTTWRRPAMHRGHTFVQPFRDVNANFWCALPNFSTAPNQPQAIFLYIIYTHIKIKTYLILKAILSFPVTKHSRCSVNKCVFRYERKPTHSSLNCCPVLRFLERVCDCGSMRNNGFTA